MMTQMNTNHEFNEESPNLRLIEEENMYVTPEMLKQAQTQLLNGSNNAKSSSNFGVNAISAAGAAFLSAVLVNPLDVAKTRLQAQAAGVPYTHPLSNAMSRMAFCGPNMIFADLRCSPTCAQAGFQGPMAICPPDCFHYKGTLDVLHKIARQEGVTRLWRGTNAALALAIPMVGIYLPLYDVLRLCMEEHASPSIRAYVPFVAGAVARSLACTTCYPIELARTRMQAFKDNGSKRLGVWKTLIGVVSNANGGTTSAQNMIQNYRMLWTGLGAQLARDVPYSAICWATLEPMRRKLSAEMKESEEANVVGILGSNFTAGFVAGSLAAGVTCPLDVARTRRQIEKDPVKALGMSTRRTLVEIWRDGGIRGLFAGAGPRIARAGPSVGIVVSFYEVVKHVLHDNLSTS